MSESTPKRTNHAQMFCEILFSLNVAWLLIWVYGTPVHSRWPFMLWPSLTAHLGDLARYSRLSNYEVVLGQIAASMILALWLSILFRIMSWFVKIDVILGPVMGAWVLLGFPLFALTFQLPGLFRLRVGNGAEVLLLAAEVLITAACGALFYFQKWPLPAPLTVGLLILHFSLWAWLTGSYMHVSVMLELFSYSVLSLIFWCVFNWWFPVIGILSSLAWGLYIKSGGGEIAQP